MFFRRWRERTTTKAWRAQLGRRFRGKAFRPELEILEDRSLLSAGILNPGFGTGGLVVTDFGGFDLANGVATQPDGKIVVVGDTQQIGTVNSSVLVSRYNKDGSPDDSFGSGGRTFFQFSGRDSGDAVALEPDGKIVVAGTTVLNANTFAEDFAVARLNADGSLDSSFGTGGKVITDFAGLSSFGSSVALEHDGKIVVAGGAASNFGTEFALARYNNDGSLDSSFGTGGQVLTSFGGEFDGATAVATQPNGRILAVGFTGSLFGFTQDFALARYDADGHLDSSFGTGGMVTTPLNGFARPSGVVVRPNGDILVVGTNFDFNTFTQNFVLARYNKDGSLDSGFGSGGIVIGDFGGTPSSASGIVVQPNGQIVVAGSLFNVSTLTADIALARFNPDGSLDTSFGTGGVVTTDLNAQLAVAGVALQSNGDIVVAGDLFNSTGTDSDIFLLECTGR